MSGTRIDNAVLPTERTCLDAEAPAHQDGAMANHERAGQPARTEDLVDVAHLVSAYFALEPDPEEISQQVAFGTSGHRGTSLNTSFNEVHIAATTQAICDYRKEQGYDGPLFIGRDTHALSEPAWATALEVLVANDVTVLVDDRDGFTPTPAVSHAILRANQGRTTGSGLADGIVVTPSHNPPGDGGFKYNPPHGGPADSDATTRHRRPRQRADPRQHRGGAPRGLRQGSCRGRAATTSSAPTSTTCRRCSTSTRSARRASASAPTRWAGRAWATGARSPTGTASTSRWSTRSSTPRGAS